MSPSIKGQFNINNGVLRIEAPLYGAGGPRGLRGRMPEIEQNPFEVFGWKQGLKPHKKISPQNMKTLRMSMPAINNCIDYIISRAISFPFKIVKEDGTKHNNFSSKRAERARLVMQGPNQFGHSYRAILSMFLNDILERDWATIEKQNMPFGGVKSINVINSIKMRPNPVNFQGDLSQAAYYEMDEMYYETIVNEFRRDEIVWANLKPQAGSFYGLSPIEYLDIMILMSLYASQHNLKLVDPVNEKGGGIIWLGDIGKPARVEFENRYRILRISDPAAPMFTAGGSQAPSFMDLKSKNDLDYSNLLLALAEMACSSYGLSLQDIGIQGKGGAGATAEVNDAITQKTAIIPRMLMLEEIITNGIIKPAGGDDLKLIFVTKKEESYETRVRAGVMALNRGGLTMNEFRNLIDEALDPYDEKMGKTPIVMLGSQVMRLEDAVKKARQPNGTVDLTKITDPGKLPQKGGAPVRNTNKKNDRGTDQGW